jgi:hypothetical protein
MVDFVPEGKLPTMVVPDYVLPNPSIDPSTDLSR